MAPGGVSALLSAGQSHTCAVIDKGIKCWGKGNEGQLGDGESLESGSGEDEHYALVPRDVMGLEPGIGAGIIAVTVGAGSDCGAVLMDLPTLAPS